MVIAVLTSEFPVDLDGHEGGRSCIPCTVDRTKSRLSAPDRQKSPVDAMATGHVRDVRSGNGALRDDERLLFSCPSSPLAPPRDHLDTPVSAGFIPGLKPG